jgi:light-regulated signal transduction histidine kinase (bacteriophytochrome)
MKQMGLHSNSIKNIKPDQIKAYVSRPGPLEETFTRDLHIPTTDLSEISKTIVEGLMLSKPERRIKFITAVSILVKGDASLLRIALRNLLHKAWRSTSHKEETLIELGIAELEGKSAYFIQYNGSGLEEDEADEMTDSTIINDEPDLHGFGLQTVKNIIHLHKGKFWIERGKGTTYYFTLE